MHSSLGDETYIPSFVFDKRQSTEPGMKHARLEAKELMFRALDELFRKSTSILAFFCVVGAAIFLSNKGTDAMRAKYKLLHTLRTHKGSNDKAFQSVIKRKMIKAWWGLPLQAFDGQWLARP
ncbi:hypothetical protein O6H91_02G109800 [Diphasiastrum complanatum]|uniref:Uncharacterized protein n=1 Tax=Diphasiastrum complanatum TaxID=34168 RepID=A0ACC2EJJ9_DIPCM|nr:hypothetical protein O6H91_02G109800 [Diphasiastrum complanatum]